MNSQEILEKAIQKAIDGGWLHSNGGYLPGSFRLVKNELSGWDDRYDIECKGHTHEAGSANDIIFNHDFAKALWGERDYTKMEHPDEYKEIPGSRQYMTAHDQAIWDMQGWRYHLQQMVIADDPIAYLEENI